MTDTAHATEVGSRFCPGCPALLALIRQPSGVIHEYRRDPRTGEPIERHICCGQS